MGITRCEGMFMLFFVLLISQSLFAETLNYKPLSFAESEVNTISVVGFVGNVKIVEDKSVRGLKVNVSRVVSSKATDDEKEFYDKWIFSYKNESGKLRLFIKEPAEKAKIIKSFANIKANLPKYNIVISGRPKPIALNWVQGNVLVKKWSEPFKIVQQKGQLSLLQTTGKADVFLSEGSFILAGGSGVVEIETYKVAEEITDFDGQLKVDNFSGSLKVNNIAGSFKLQQQSGSIEISRGKGQIDFEAGAAKLKLNKFSGEFRGKSGRGEIVAELIDDARFRVSTVDGPVSVSTAGGGSRINIGSEKGSLYGPRHLRRKQWASIKTLSGHMRGKNNKGSVFVRTKTANIKVR